MLLSVTMAVIAAAGKTPVRTEKCRRNKVLQIPNGKLKRVSKGAEEFLVRCDKGFKVVMGPEVVVRCSREAVIENVEDAPKCMKKKTKKNKNKRKESKVKELLVGDWKRREKMLRKHGTDVQGRLPIIELEIDLSGGFW